MTALTQSTKRKLSLLQLAEELGNVSKACKLMGYHRDTFYQPSKDDDDCDVCDRIRNSFLRNTSRTRE